jgi:anti-sigma factor RsiW
VTHRTPSNHLSAERMQAFLDGELPAADARAVESHVDGCARCRAELSAWEVLFEDLGDLPVLTPSTSFQDRILEATPRKDARATGAAGTVAHVAPGRLQDYLEGRLAARAIASVESHLDTCAVCRSELAAFRAVGMALDALPALEPSPEFGERVLAAWRVEQMAAVAMAPTTRWGRVVAWARSRAPSSRQGWAAALGVATAPAVIALLLVRAVFSHPLVTVGNLSAFVRLQAGDLLGALAARGAALLQSVGLDAAAGTAVELLSSPPVAAGAATVASGLTFAALWVVYRFLIASQPADRPYAHVSR